MNNIINIFIIFILILAPLNASGTDLNNAEEFVNKFADEAITILNNNEISDNEKNDKFTNLVMSAIDLNLISQFVLSKTWKSATNDQKERYISAFEKYFINSSVLALPGPRPMPSTVPSIHLTPFVFAVMVLASANFMLL